MTWSQFFCVFKFLTNSFENWFWNFTNFYDIVSVSSMIESILSHKTFTRIFRLLYESATDVIIIAYDDVFWVKIFENSLTLFNLNDDV